jgi:hypothetical protein
MMAKTDWQMGDTVKPDDLNQIGQEINQNRDNLAAHTAATTGVHGATSAATPNTIVQRDPAGRFKAAAPVEADDVARKAEVDAHAARTDNPHAVTKAQVGLGSVDNYPTASQAEAEAGTAANRFMTPQRTKQYVDTRLLNDLKFRLNNGSLEFNDGTGWKSVGFDPRSMTHHEIAHYVLGQTVPADGYIDVWNVSAKGVLAEVQIVVISTTASTRSLGVSLVIDGAEKQFFAPSSPEIAAAQLVAMAGSNNFGNDASDARIFKLNHPIPFNSSVRIRIRNVHANQAVTNVFVGVIGGYYT